MFQPVNTVVLVIILCSLLTWIPNDGNQKDTFNVRMASLINIPETPIMSIYAVNNGSQGIYAVNKGSKDFLCIIIVVWVDGRIIWSKDDARGGQPYFQNNIEPKKIREFLKSLEQDGVFCSSQSDKSYLGPDSDYIEIAIYDGTNRLYVGSWHELFEKNPNLVATNTGISSMKYYGGISRQEVLDKQPDDYREFRRIWNIVREEAKTLIPEDGQQIEDAKFEIRRL